MAAIWQLLLVFWCIFRSEVRNSLPVHPNWSKNEFSSLTVFCKFGYRSVKIKFPPPLKVQIGQFLRCRTNIYKNLGEFWTILDLRKYPFLDRFWSVSHLVSAKKVKNFRRASRANFSLAVLLFTIFPEFLAVPYYWGGGVFNFNTPVVSDHTIKFHINIHQNC